MVTEAKMAHMTTWIGLGNSLEGAKRKGIVETPEEETFFLQLEREIRAIHMAGGTTADMGDATFTDPD